MGPGRHVTGVTDVVQNSEAAIFSRVVSPDNANLSADAANSILQITFPAGDRERMNVLAEKARYGTLSAEEACELDNYSRVGRLLEVLKSKARLSLKTPRAA
jgi:hypothetical protein